MNTSLCITEGSGILKQKSGIYIPVNKGQVIVIFPVQCHSYIPIKETGWNEYYIGFNGEVIDELVQNSFVSGKNHYDVFNFHFAVWS